MGVVLNTNMSAMAAHTNLRASQARVDTSLERLSSGLRINRAADDAAGLAISEKLRAQANGLNQARRNAQDGISLMQTADGGLNETHALLQRMRTLVVQAGNSGVLSDAGLRAIQAEIGQLTTEINQVADGSEFNTQRLLDGTFLKKNLQIGANPGDTMQVDIYSRYVPPVPAIPPSPPSPAGTALWDVDTGLASIANPVTIEQTVGGAPVTVSVPTPQAPGPTLGSVTELAALLNADPAFGASFTASVGSYTKADGVPHTDVNLIIRSKTPGVGEVTVTGVATSWRQVDMGFDGTPGVPEQPERFLGFHAEELLEDVVDVTRKAGSSTTPGGKQIVGGESTGFGNGSFSPPREVTFPPVTTAWPSGAEAAIEKIDRAIALVSKGRTDIGAYQNRLTHVERSLGVSAENLAASQSRIQDADMAKEMAALSAQQILTQAGTAMLAQANQLPQHVLKLLPNGST